MSRIGWVLSLVALLLHLAGCGGAETQRRFEVTGVVVEPLAEGEIVIDHAEIPGFMPAMTMPFYVDRADPVVSQLRPGDRIAFTFVVGDDASFATAFRRQKGASPRVDAAGSVDATDRRRPASQRLREGEKLPAFNLIDQSGDAFTDENLQGRRTVLTFIFTRCPVPEFCPRMMNNFSVLQERIQSDDAFADVRLASVSIDPEHDRPDVLRAYGEAHGANFDRWTFATGTPEEVERVRRLFAVVVQPSSSSLDHTLTTALIGPDLSVIAIWHGNAWKPDQVIAALESRE